MNFARVVGSLACAVACVANGAPLTPPAEFLKSIEIDDARGTRRSVEQGGVDPNMLDEKGDTALIAAIRGDATHVVDYLIGAKQVDLDRTNASLETPMMIAAFRNRIDIVAKLLDRGAQVNRPGWTALHYAASIGNAEIVKLLLDESAYIDAESPNKTTPLMMAARGGHAEVARLLIAEGADPTPINERDLSASDFAKRAGKEELARWLDERVVAWRAKYGNAPNRQGKP